MKKLLNTLYVLTPESYLFCRNENICIRIGEHEKLCVPALTIDAIVCFGKMTVSTPLLQYCAEHGISVTFVTETGRFMGRFYGSVSGNVLLRKRQYESLNEDTFCKQLVRSVLSAKLRNCKLVLMRSARSAKNEEAVYLNERGRRTLLSAWQRRKQEEIIHPFLGEKVQIGMIPYAQAMLFARVLRGDLDAYPPFVWR